MLLVLDEASWLLDDFLPLHDVWLEYASILSTGSGQPGLIIQNLDCSPFWWTLPQRSKKISEFAS